MILTSIKYSEFVGTNSEWKLEEISLNKINLIVAKNATGKSRVLSLISNLSVLLSGDSRTPFSDAHYIASFDNEKTSFEIQIKGGMILKEELKIDKQIVLKRGTSGEGEIFYPKLNNQMIEFKIPENHVATLSKRDAIQHPFLEDICTWAENAVFYNFGGNFGKNHFISSGMNKEHNQIKGQSNFRDEAKVLAYYKRGLDKSPDFEKMVLGDINRLGYEVTDIKLTHSVFNQGSITVNLPAEAGAPMGLMIKEKDHNAEVMQLQISQGMYRALAIIIHMNYISISHSPSTILIDDIGEGLDYSRSLKLINLIIEKCSGHNYQLILSSNDQFVMNAVPLESWHILIRQGGICKVINKQNSPDIFENFEFTGLSNFDLLTSEMYLR